MAIPLKACARCVIAGGGSIGAAAARLFLKESAKVALVDRDETGLAAAVADLAHS